ncbi:MAG: DUF2809 domain-containing protein [Blastocatellia bacterium]|nr:DUF2809 domain-containing protein [Blastocatellia bacterium]
MIESQLRSRLVYAGFIAVVIALGLASRTQSTQSYLPQFISEYAGDTLWALTAFLGLGFLFPKFSTWRVAVLALGFAVLIECSQLYHAPWIESLRHTRLGGLVLGFGFLWSDLVCYGVGVACGVGLEWLCGFGKRPKSA